MMRISARVSLLSYFSAAFTLATLTLIALLPVANAQQGFFSNSGFMIGSPEQGGSISGSNTVNSNNGASFGSLNATNNQGSSWSSSYVQNQSEGVNFADTNAKSSGGMFDNSAATAGFGVQSNTSSNINTSDNNGNSFSGFVNTHDSAPPSYGLNFSQP